MRFIERFLPNQYELDRFDEESRYTPARTVGSARVKDVLSFGDNPQFEIVLLDLEVQEEGIKVDKSQESR